MAMDNDFAIDMSEVFEMIDRAEVLVVRFPLFEKRLLMDARKSERGPQLLLAPRVQSLEERYRFLRESRPDAAVPDRLMFVPWPKRVESFIASGGWDRIVGRVEQVGGGGPVADYEALLDEMRGLERDEALAAVKGDGYKPLWERDAGE